MPQLEREGEVFVLHLAGVENRFHPDWLTAVESALDEVDARTGPRALVTAGSGKFWSNGPDLDWMSAHGDQYTAYLDRVHRLFARTLASPVVTVAALDGHAFAAGAMWALVHDLRVMRADRDYFCLPEGDIDLSFRRGASQLIRSRLNPAVAHEAMTTGWRYAGDAALTAGIVDAIEDSDQLLTAAVEFARPLTNKVKPQPRPDQGNAVRGNTRCAAHQPPDEGPAGRAVRRFPR